MYQISVETFSAITLGIRTSNIYFGCAVIPEKTLRKLVSCFFNLILFRQQYFK